MFSVEDILCYLKGTLGHGIIYSDHGQNKIQCFPHANWLGSKDRKSTFDYCVSFGGEI